MIVIVVLGMLPDTVWRSERLSSSLEVLGFLRVWGKLGLE